VTGADLIGKQCEAGAGWDDLGSRRVRVRSLWVHGGIGRNFSNTCGVG